MLYCNYFFSLIIIIISDLCNDGSAFVQLNLLSPYDWHSLIALICCECHIFNAFWSFTTHSKNGMQLHKVRHVAFGFLNFSFVTSVVPLLLTRWMLVARRHNNERIFITTSSFAGIAEVSNSASLLESRISMNDVHSCRSDLDKNRLVKKNLPRFRC